MPAAGDVQGDEGFYGIPPLTRVRDYSRDGVRRSLEESLERLGLDRVDIALIHDPDDFMGAGGGRGLPGAGRTPRPGRGPGHRRRDELRVRRWPGWPSAATWTACWWRAGTRCSTSRPRPSLFPLCQRRGVAVLAGGVFNSGILAGPDDGATYDYAPAPPAVLARARRMRDACARHGVPLPAAALQFTVAPPGRNGGRGRRAHPGGNHGSDVSYLSTRIPDALWAELAVLLTTGLLTTGLLPGRCEFLAQVSAAASAHASYS